MLQEFQQKLYEQYRTEHFGAWHTRECYPWEYDTQIQECIRLADKSFDWWIPGEKEWFLQQAKIFQDRASYIRQKWATQQVTQSAVQQATPPTPSTQESTQQFTQPGPQQEEEQPLQQEIAESTTENPTESTVESTVEKKSTASSSNDNTSLLSTIPRQRTTTIYRESTSFSNAPLVASQHASVFTSQHAQFLESLPLASLLGYIRYAEDMKATGQG